ncbi:MAG: hypothetical protein V1858_02080 [Candidatus Gottesmanbacteria bacterium]
MTGWVKLYRKLNESSFKTHPLVVALFVHLLLNANHQDKEIFWNGQKITIKKGQLITSRKNLSLKTGISERAIRTTSEILISTSTIAIKTTNRFSLISILNWSKYQDKTTNETTNETTSRPLKNDQQSDHKQEDKNDKKLKPCSYHQLWTIAQELEVPLETVVLKHNVILDKIAAGEYKYKTVYFTLRNWLRGDIEKGFLSKVDDIGKLQLQAQSPENRAKVDEALKILGGKQ